MEDLLIKDVSIQEPHLEIDGKICNLIPKLLWSQSHRWGVPIEVGCVGEIYHLRIGYSKRRLQLSRII